MISTNIPKNDLRKRNENGLDSVRGKDKEHATAMLLGDSDGYNYPLFVVLKQKPLTIKTQVQENLTHRNGCGVRVWEEAHQLMRLWPSRLYVNPSAWWNNHLAVEFLEFHFGGRAEMDEKVLLLWDDFSGHFTNDVVACAQRLNILLERCPPPIYVALPTTRHGLEQAVENSATNVLD
ncbi:Aste57867_3711 [Aphanomyces stellatus]|uniref:Aste57867_3711 protein n=1 Tax=Aphanomyces stellatus TaxID=120398 RepID=A0A485KA89_9STRA|nr:hypothetical protein As57867_003700 [Aphanomyces stellatus]VFT80865.1 Aste57867_3711 [Aphanomyces stellatus]